MNHRTAPPLIFAPHRRLAARRRMLARQNAPDAARFVFDDIADDMIERLAFLRQAPQRALVIGDPTGILAASLQAGGCGTEFGDPARGFDEERPFGEADYDFIASVATLDTVNDLPGALIHMKRALRPGGLMLASFAGAGSLPCLRHAMFAADGERPAPRIHPHVDVRAGGQLLQRAGFANPVADSRTLEVSYRSLATLIGDLRDQGLSNVLSESGPALTRAALARASERFMQAGPGRRTLETFEIMTLSGWKA